MNNNNFVAVYKRKTSGNSIEKRLQKMEQILYALAQLIENNAKNTVPSDSGNMAAGGRNLAELISRIALTQGRQVAMGRESGGQEFAAPSWASGNIQKSGNKSLSLSEGQVIAELAAAVLRANQRNL